MSDSCAAVRSLFWPQSCRHFVERYWERTHHIVRGSQMANLSGAIEGFPRVLQLEDLAVMATHWDFKVREDHSQAVILRPGTFSHDSGWPEGSRLTPAEMQRALRGNRSVVLHNVELYWRPIARLSLALHRHVGGYSQANVYVSPPGLPVAVHAHQDAQSVFIVQCEGTKRWTLLSPPQRWRLRYNQRGKAGDAAPAEELTTPVGEYVLRPDDVLFVPRGMYHYTSTTDGGAHSLHVTIGVETDTDEWTWLSWLQEAAAALGLQGAKEPLDAALWHDERLREALPLSLYRVGATLAADAHGHAWLAHAHELLREHAGARPAEAQLRAALDAGLARRQEFVEKKRLQLLDFRALSPRAPPAVLSLT
jgi:hypothetical protein